MQEKAIEVMKKPLAPSNTSRAFTNGINSHLNLSNSKTRGKLLLIIIAITVFIFSNI